jgi:putative SOS response-associated peptidase YedK
MCGRFVRKSSIQTIAREFHTETINTGPEPSYNIAPSENIIIIVNDGTNRVMHCTWGFIPSWAKDQTFSRRMINARAETAADKPSFRSAFIKQRGLIIADGFYEWRKKDKKKIPVYIHLRSGKPFGFAGLYSSWTSPDGERVCTCAIITTNSNTLLQPIHDRMPVIIPKDKEGLWLDPHAGDKMILQGLLKPYSSEEMTTFDVSPAVNSPGHNSPDNIQPV